MKFILLFLLSVNVFGYAKTPMIWIAAGDLCNEKDKDFDGYRYADHVAHCKRKVSRKVKVKVCALYGVTDRKGYTVDHIIPLALGGSNKETNLWCQSRKIYSANLEFYYYRQLLKGKIRQAEAIHAIMAYKFNPVGKDHVPYPPK